MCIGEAGNGISILCAGQATKNVLDGSAEPRYQMRHMKHKTKQNILRHIQTKECVYICEKVDWLKGDFELKLKQKGW